MVLVANCQYFPIATDDNSIYRKKDLFPVSYNPTQKN